MNQRHVTATQMNSESSRSHLIVSIMMDVKDIHTGGVITGKLTLVDLAGSERVKKSEASGQSMEIWISKGWITSDDPLGWFQWYCRYHMGRRIPDVDLFQIKRHNNFGPRHAGAIRKHCPGQYHKRTKQRQALLQWAYDPFI